MLTQVKINSVDVTSACVRWDYEISYGDILSEMTLTFVRSVNDLVTLVEGATLQVWRGWLSATEEKILEGYVEKFESEGGRITVIGIDRMWDAVRSEVNKIYDSAVDLSAGKLSAIFQDLINNYSSAVTESGTNTSTSAGKLIDSTALFQTNGVQVSDHVWNQSTNGWATVSSVDSETQLTLSSDIFPVAGGTGKYYTVKPSDSMIADSTSVQDSGTTLVLAKFVCNHTDPFERCKKLADTLDWQFYYKSSTGKAYFEPRGYSTNSNTLTVGSNVIRAPKWQRDTTEMVNDVTIVGAYQEVETTKSGQIGVTSGFTTTYIQLDYIPISVKVYGDANNPPTTLKTGGVPDSTSSFDYYVDLNQKKIVPKGGTTFTTNHFYEIRYSLACPVPVNAYNQDSIDSYGRFKKTVTYKDIRNVADAEMRGDNYLARYSVPFIYTTLLVKNVSTYGLFAGQNISVIDTVSTPNVNTTLTINKIRIRFPGDYVELDVGDKFWRLANFNSTVLEKFKRLEEDELSNLEIINNVVTMDNRTVSPIQIENRYQQVLTQTVSGTNCFILGNADYGKLGTGHLGSGDIGAETTAYLRQFENSYSETFYDTDFKDASTTATWNTSTKQLTFTSGQIGLSTSVDKNNGTITSATMTVTKSSGTFTYYLSADGGSHWETVSSGVAHTFSNTGTDLRWKIAEAASSTGTVTNVEITSYH
jgi:hypothetical protein